jgi:hypothetical protein
MVLIGVARRCQIAKKSLKELSRYANVVPVREGAGRGAAYVAAYADP